MTQQSQPWKTLLLALVLFLLTPFLLQLSVQLKIGNSILTSAFARSAAPVVLFGQRSGYQWLTPDIKFASSSPRRQSNQYGQRLSEALFIHSEL